MSKSEYSLIYSFEGKSNDYVYGFIMGDLWRKLQCLTEPFVETITNNLKEDVISLCTHLGWKEEITDIENDWMQIKFTKEGE